VIEEIKDVASEEKNCSICGCARPEFFKTEDSKIVEVQVSAYIRKIRRKQYKPCQCERDKLPGVIAAPSAPRLYLEILVITDLGELDFYQAQAVVGARTIAHNILILLHIFVPRLFVNDFI
jgi:hypothetical protein